MLRAILSMFASEEKVEAMLSHFIIEFIFISLFSLFAITLIVHIALYMKLSRVRQHIKGTGALTIDPVQTIEKEFKEEAKADSTAIDTFVQERFSNWRLFQMPVINWIKLTKMTVSVFILLGVLGTFIGLTISLSNMNMATDQLVENIAVVLSGIDVAFYTSIIGMGFSLSITVLLKVMNTEYMLTDIMLMTERKLAENSKQGLPKLIEVSENINESIGKLQITHEKSLAGIINAFAGFKNYTDSLIQAAKDLASFNKGLRENLKQFEGIFTDIKTLTNSFERGTTTVNENFNKLFTFIDTAGENQKRSLTLFEQTYENITAANERQTQAITNFEGTVTRLKTFSENLLTEQVKSSQALHRIHEESSHFVKKMEENNETLSRTFGDNLSAQLGGIARKIEELAGHFNRVGNTFVELPGALKSIHETQAEYRYLLGERFQDLEQFNESFREHLRNHTDESMKFEMNLRDAMNSFDQVGTKNKELIHELHRVATDLLRGYQSREQEGEAMVRSLERALQGYVSSVERTLDERLENITREISESLRDLTREVSGEIYGIGERTEELQQRQVQGLGQLYEGIARELQRTLQEIAREMRQAVDRSPSSARRTISVNNELGWHDYER